ncbi:MAG: DsrE family protein [Leeuwenhoekiella sp.]
MKNSLIPLITLFIAMNTFAQTKVTGNVIKNYGTTFAVPDPDFKTDTSQIFKVVFNIVDPAEDESEINRYFDSVARFLNMNENAGVPLKNFDLVMVVHGGAAMGLLNNETYKEKYDVDNPNLDLLDALHAANVKVILCGQTAGSRGLSKENIWPNTQIALSAMTALVQLQNDGYKLITF